MILVTRISRLIQELLAVLYCMYVCMYVRSKYELLELAGLLNVVRHITICN